MLKKGSDIKWDGEPSTAFHKIKQAIKDAPILKALDCEKPMHISSFASFHMWQQIYCKRMEKGMNSLLHFLVSPFNLLN